MYSLVFPDIQVVGYTSEPMLRKPTQDSILPSLLAFTSSIFTQYVVTLLWIWPVRNDCSVLKYPSNDSRGILVR